MTPLPFPEDLRRFVETEPWTFAKSYAKTWPHEYLVRERVDERQFLALVTHIREHGYAGWFYKKPITYFDEAGMVYWTMGAPIDETTVVNRCRKGDSYESRLKAGTLPEQRAHETETGSEDGSPSPKNIRVPKHSPTGISFEEMFKTSEPRRDKFLSRLLGIFSEDIVRHWCECEASPYVDRGRPTLRTANGPKGYTLDFTLEDRKGRSFVAELKCELEYQNYRFLRLNDPTQLDHHRTKDAFRIFLAASSDPASVAVYLRGKQVEIAGGILIWGATDASAATPCCQQFGFHEVLSLENMLRDLQKWAPTGWTRRVAELRRWSNGLFDFFSFREGRMPGTDQGEPVALTPSASPDGLDGSAT